MYAYIAARYRSAYISSGHILTNYLLG